MARAMREDWVYKLDEQDLRLIEMRYFIARRNVNRIAGLAVGMT